MPPTTGQPERLSPQDGFPSRTLLHFAALAALVAATLLTAS